MFQVGTLNYLGIFKVLNNPNLSDIMLSTTFFQEKPKKHIPHRYSEVEYTVMRENINNVMRGILDVLIFHKISKILERIIRICFQNIMNSVKYVFNISSYRPVQLYNKNFDEALNHIQHTIETSNWDKDNLVEIIIPKLSIIKQNYYEQVKYLTELEEQSQKEQSNK